MLNTTPSTLPFALKAARQREHDRLLKAAIWQLLATDTEPHAAQVEIGGLTFVWLHGTLRLRDRCPACGGITDSEPINNHSDLAAQLAGFTPHPLHACRRLVQPPLSPYLRLVARP